MRQDRIDKVNPMSTAPSQKTGPAGSGAPEPPLPNRDGDPEAWHTNRAVLLALLALAGKLDDPRAIMAAAVETIGQHLKATRAGYVHIVEDGRTLVHGIGWVADAPPSAAEPVPVAFPGLWLAGVHRAGQTVVVHDARAGSSAIPDWNVPNVSALIAVPMTRDAGHETCLFVAHPAARHWQSDEVRFVEDVGARTWDVIKRARAEDALRRLNASLEKQVGIRTRERDRTWQVAPALMLIGGPDGTLLECNPAWTRVLGWTREETIGHGVMEFVAPEDRAVGIAGLERLFQGQPVFDYQNTFVTKTGERRRIAWTTVPEGGRLYGYGRDITDQSIAEERLRQAQKMEAVGQLTGGLAHDFNNLLTGIIGSIELLRMRVAQEKVQDLDRHAVAALAAARRAASLTHRLLAFSRQQTLDPRPTDVNRLVAGMEELIRRTVGSALDMCVEAQPDVWTTLVDPHQLENALLNLCINARDAMPDGGRLTIGTANRDLSESAAQALELPPGHYVSLSVGDTGTGMTPEVVRRAFDPFFTTKPLGAGTGLGLSMIYGFARQSGGQAHIDAAVGKGASVTIYLPAYRDPDGTAPPAPEPAAEPALETGAEPAVALPEQGGQGETILIVDDEVDLRSMVAELLRDLNYEAIEAADGAAALAIIRSGTHVGLLVTDVGLPGGMNGRQLADAARAIRAGLPVLFITGYGEATLAGDAALDAGMRVLGKPFALDVLADWIRQMIAGG